MTKKLFVMLTIVLFASSASAGSNLLTIRDKAQCEAAGGAWLPGNPMFPCGPKTTTIQTPPASNPTEQNPATFTTEAECLAAKKFVWDESTIPVFGRAACRIPKSGETPPGTMGEDGVYTASATIPLPTQPANQAEIQGMKDLFIEWSAATHWAKRREMIKDELELIEGLMPPGEAAMMIFVLIGDKGFYAKLDLFDKLVLVEAQIPISVPPEFDVFRNSADRRADMARVLYFMSAE